MGIVIGWIIFSVIVGAIGSSRNIGFAGAFFASLFLSPIIGLIITLVSKNKDDEMYKQQLLASQNEQQEALNGIKDNSNASSLSDELNSLNELKKNGILNDDEFQKAKEKLLSK